MHRPLRPYVRLWKRRSTLILAVVVLPTAALLSAQLRQHTQQPASVAQMLERVEAEQRATSGQTKTVKITVQAGADTTKEDVGRCEASGRIVVVRLADLSVTGIPEAACVDAKHLEPLPRLNWVTLP